MSRLDGGETLKRAVRVLIVDDVEDSREMYAEYLRFRGFEVVTADNGEDGLTDALAAPPDVVVLDLTMPRLDGWSLATRLRAESRTTDTRILVLSAHALSGTEEGARAAGAHSFLTKPCLPEQLTGEIDRLLQSREQMTRDSSAESPDGATNSGRVEAFIVERRPSPVCASCVARALELRANAVQRAATMLEGLPAFVREHARCAVCGRTRLVMRARPA